MPLPHVSCEIGSRLTSTDAIASEIRVLAYLLFALANLTVSLLIRAIFGSALIRLVHDHINRTFEVYIPRRVYMHSRIPSFLTLAWKYS